MIEFSGIDSKEQVAFVITKAGKVRGHYFKHLLVRSGNLAHGPIGAEHYAVGTKRLEYNIQVRSKILHLPICPISLSYQARNFAIKVVILSQLADVSFPVRDLP